jgi:hypothetical protein
MAGGGWLVPNAANFVAEFLVDNALRLSEIDSKTLFLAL